VEELIMDDDIDRDVGLPLAGDDEVMPTEESKKDPDDDMDDNFDRELREAERELEAIDVPEHKIKLPKTEDVEEDEDE
jgi:hypothetical protein